MVHLKIDGYSKRNLLVLLLPFSDEPCEKNPWGGCFFWQLKVLWGVLRKDTTDTTHGFTMVAFRVGSNPPFWMVLKPLVNNGLKLYQPQVVLAGRISEASTV